MFICKQVSYSSDSKGDNIYFCRNEKTKRDMSGYKEKLIQWAVNHPGGLWADNEGAAAARKWLRANAPEELSALYWNESDEIRRGIDRRFIPEDAKEKEMEMGVSDAMNDFGNKMYNVVDTATAFMPGPVGTLNWLAYMGANGAQGKWGNMAFDLALAGAAAGVGRGIGKLIEKTQTLRKGMPLITRLKGGDDLMYHLDYGDGVGAGATIHDGYLIPDGSSRAGQSGRIQFNRGKPYSLGTDGKMFDRAVVGKAEDIPGLAQVHSTDVPAGYATSSFVPMDNMTVYNRHHLPLIGDFWVRGKQTASSPSIYGNLRFIRNLNGVPNLNSSGTVNLGRKGSDVVFTNFTTDVPFRLHPNYGNMPGGDFVVVDPAAFRGKRPWSIEPSDTFFLARDASDVDPKYITFISGNADNLAAAEKAGMRTKTSPALQSSYAKIADELKSMEAAAAEDRLVKTGWGELSNDLIKDYRGEIISLLDDMGRPTLHDYQMLEGVTGLSSRTKAFDSSDIERINSAMHDLSATNPVNRTMKDWIVYPDGRSESLVNFKKQVPYFRLLPENYDYKNVFYHPFSPIENGILNAAGVPSRHSGHMYDDVLQSYFGQNIHSNPLGEGGSLRKGISAEANPTAYSVFTVGGPLRKYQDGGERKGLVKPGAEVSTFEDKPKEPEPVEIRDSEYKGMSYEDVCKYTGAKRLIDNTALEAGVPKDKIAEYWNEGRLLPMMEGRYPHIFRNGLSKDEHGNLVFYQGAKKPNTSKTSISRISNDAVRISSDVQETMLNRQNYGRERNKKYTLPNLKYGIPFLPETGIVDLGKGSYITYNALDSLAKYGVMEKLTPEEYLGLPKRETGFGRYLGAYVSSDIPQSMRAYYNMNYFNNYGFIPAENLVNDWAYNMKDAKGESVHSKTDMPPLQHAFRYFKSGKYNPGELGHTDYVLQSGKDILANPGIQEWMAQSKYVDHGYEDGGAVQYAGSQTSSKDASSVPQDSLDVFSYTQGVNMNNVATVYEKLKEQGWYLDASGKLVKQKK